VLARHLGLGHAGARALQNREAEIISQLEAPAYRSNLDFDTTEQGEPYIVMELLRGESPFRALGAGGCLPIVEAARITHQVASGLFCRPSSLDHSS